MFSVIFKLEDVYTGAVKIANYDTGYCVFRYLQGSSYTMVDVVRFILILISISVLIKFRFFRLF